MKRKWIGLTHRPSPVVTVDEQEIGSLAKQVTKALDPDEMSQGNPRYFVATLNRVIGRAGMPDEVRQAVLDRLLLDSCLHRTVC